jgi:hypothetical protein
MFILSWKQILISKLLWFRQSTSPYDQPACITFTKSLETYFDIGTIVEAKNFLACNKYRSIKYDLALVSESEVEKFDLAKCISYETDYGISFGANPLSNCKILYVQESEIDIDALKDWKSSHPTSIIIYSLTASSTMNKNITCLYQYVIYVPTDPNYFLKVLEYDENNPVSIRSKK